MQGYELSFTDQSQACSGGWHSGVDWKASNLSLSYTTGEHKTSSMQIYASIDEQLHDWDAFWTSFPSADPFHSDWTSKPFEYT